MTGKSPSLWERLQLRLLRLLAAVLGLIDGLFRVQWGERLLERLSRRWETQITEIDRALTQLEKEREQLYLQAEAIAIHAAVIYLGGRSLAHNELTFDPADPRDEEMLDATIDLLVKEKLAAIEPQEIEAGRYIYHLEPDWPALRARLVEAVEQVEPQTADWLAHGIRFIDEAFLAQS